MTLPWIWEEQEVFKKLNTSEEHATETGTIHSGKNISGLSRNVTYDGVERTVLNQIHSWILILQAAF